MYRVSYAAFEQLVQQSRTRAATREPSPVPKEKPGRRTNDLVECRYCGASVRRDEVLPGGYCPVCKR